ncbi:MAG: hypothetical protein HY660_17955 [Armatimonadetes bacterium]|nr:hypothetical protein [Armatimonadota bacterium]
MTGGVSPSSGDPGGPHDAGRAGGGLSPPSFWTGAGLNQVNDSDPQLDRLLDEGRVGAVRKHVHGFQHWKNTHWQNTSCLGLRTTWIAR